MSEFSEPYRISVQSCTADHPAGKHMICPHLEMHRNELEAAVRRLQAQHDRLVAWLRDNQATKRVLLDNLGPDAVHLLREEGKTL
jgi:hypothetical protein